MPDPINNAGIIAISEEDYANMKCAMGELFDSVQGKLVDDNELIDDLTKTGEEVTKMKAQLVNNIARAEDDYEQAAAVSVKAFYDLIRRMDVETLERGHLADVQAELNELLERGTIDGSFSNLRDLIEEDKNATLIVQLEEKSGQ